MNKFKRLTKTTFLIGLLFSVASCTKDTNTIADAIYLHKNGETIPSYTSFEDMLNELNTCLKLRNESIDSLSKYEDAKGFHSIGRLADEYYFNCIDSIDYDSSLLYKLLTNTDYVTTNIEGNDTFYLPKFSSIPQRFIANSNGLYKIGDYVTRVFEEGLVTTHINNLTLLEEILPSELNNLDTNFFFYSPVYSEDDNVLIEGEKGNEKGDHAIYLFGLQEQQHWPSSFYTEFQGDDANHSLHNRYMEKSEESTSGNYKVKMKLYFTRQFVISFTGNGGKYFSAFVECSSYKKRWHRLWTLEPSSMDINLELLSCVEEYGIMSRINSTVSCSSYYKLLYTAYVKGMYTNGKKYVHFRGSKSEISSNKVTYPAYLIFGDLSNFIY